MSQVKIKSEKILSDEHYVLKRIDFEIQQKDGKWETQNREVFNHGDAVTVLLYNKEKRTVIFTKQFRIATYVNGNSSGLLYLRFVRWLYHLSVVVQMNLPA